MSAGLSFGSLPSFADLSPEMQAQVMASLMGQGGGQPAPTAPAGIGASLLGQRAPGFAGSEADVQHLERQQAGPQDMAALGGSPVDRLTFDRTPFGGGSSGFTGQADPYGARAMPLPPGRPSDEDLMAPPPVPTATGSVAGMNPGAAGPGNRPNSPAIDSKRGIGPSAGPDAPSVVDGFDPLTGAVTSGSPRPVGAPQAGVMSTFLDAIGGKSGAPATAQGPGPVSAAGAAQATAQAGGQAPGFLEKFVQNVFSGAGTNSPLFHLGLGIASNRGFGPGIAAGMQNFQEAQRQGAATDLARAKFGIEQAKFQQQQAGQNATVALLQRKGYSASDALSIVQASQGGNATALNAALGNAVPKNPDAPSGYRNAADGGLDAIPRGPADLKTIEADAIARAPDRTQTPLTDPDARLAAGIPAYDNRAAWKDKDGKVTFDNGPNPKITTTRNPDQSSTARRYDAPTDSFVPVAGGGSTGPGAADLAGQKEGMGLALKSLETSVGGIHSGTFPQMKSLDRLEQNLKSGIYTGAGADRAAKIAGFLDQLGIGDHGKLANTQEFLNSAAQDYARLAKSTFPQRVTNADLGVAKIMAGTNLDQTQDALQNAIAMQRENAHMSIAQHNARVDKFAKAFPGQQNLADFYRVDPGEYGMGQNAPAQQQAPADREQGQSQAPAADPLASARTAIAQGAPRSAVIQRLQQNGIDPKGL